MDGDQALQLLPTYQQTIIQQQQEIRVCVCLFVCLFVCLVVYTIQE